MNGLSHRTASFVNIPTRSQELFLNRLFGPEDDSIGRIHDQLADENWGKLGTLIREEHFILPFFRLEI